MSSREKLLSGKSFQSSSLFPTNTYPDEIISQRQLPWQVLNESWNYGVTYDLEPVTIFIFGKQRKVFCCEITAMKWDNINWQMQCKGDATYKEAKSPTHISIVMKKIFAKANTLHIFQKNITLVSKLLKKNFTNMQGFFSWKEKVESENYLCFSKQRVTSRSEIASNVYCVCQHGSHTKAHHRKEEPDRKTNKRHHERMVSAWY